MTRDVAFDTSFLLFIQMQMAAAQAELHGHDLSSDLFVRRRLAYALEVRLQPSAHIAVERLEQGD